MTGEICKPLLKLHTGQSYTATDYAYVITEAHSHMDILRYVVGDVGHEHCAALLDSLRDHGWPEGET